MRSKTDSLPKRDLLKGWVRQPPFLDCGPEKGGNFNLASPRVPFRGFTPMYERSLLILGVVLCGFLLGTSPADVQVFPGCDALKGLTNGVNTDGSILPAGDKDCWTFSVSNDEQLICSVTPKSGSQLKTRLELWTNYEPSRRLETAEAGALGDPVTLEFFTEGVQGGLVLNVQGVSGSSGDYVVRREFGQLGELCVSPTRISHTVELGSSQSFEDSVDVCNCAEPFTDSFPWSRGTPEFSPAGYDDWLSLSGDSGSRLSPGQCDTFSIEVDSHNLPVGEYTATIAILTHEPAYDSPQDVSVVLTVNDTPVTYGANLSVTPNSRTVKQGEEAHFGVVVTNTGSHTDEFQMTMTSYSDWGNWIEDWRFTLGSGDSTQELDSYFRSKTDTIPDGYPCSYTITSLGSGEVEDQKDVNVLIEHNHPNSIDNASLHSPSSITVETGETIPYIYGRILVHGITDDSGQGANITGELGYGIPNTDPSSWSEWVTADYFNDVNDLDQYRGQLQVDVPGEYAYCFRFKRNEGNWVYGDLDGSANGIQTDQFGELIVESEPDQYWSVTVGQDGIDSEGTMRVETQVDESLGVVKVFVTNPTLLFRRLEVSYSDSASPDGSKLHVDPAPPISLENAETFVADCVFALSPIHTDNLIGPQETRELTIPLEEGREIRIWLMRDDLEDLRQEMLWTLDMINRGDLDSAGLGAGRYMAAFKSIQANLINLQLSAANAGLHAVSSKIVLVKRMLQAESLITGTAQLGYDTLTGNLTLEEMASLYYEVLSQWVSFGGGAELLADLWGFSTEQVKDAFGSVSAILSIPEWWNEMERALGFLHDAWRVSSLEYIILEIHRQVAPLRVTGVSGFEQVQVGSQHVIRVTVRNEGTIPINNAYIDLRLYANRGEWGDNTGTGLPTSIVETFYPQDQNTAMPPTFFGCGSDYASGAFIGQLSPGCTAQFSYTYVFDRTHSKIMNDQTPGFEYLPGRYEWQLLVPYSTNENGQIRSYVAGFYSDQFEIGYSGGETPSTPGNLSYYEGDEDLVCTWSGVNDYDVAEYRVYEAPVVSGKTTTQTENWNLVWSGEDGVTTALLEKPAESMKYVVRAYSEARGESRASNSVVYSPQMMGDSNNDGVVNLDDYRATRDHFGETGAGFGDADHNGVVNLDDYRSTRDHFGEVRP